ncbi:hypothetical protein [Clostridium sp.]|uniref:transmembrane-type terpene cyclase n=1 Tax=Clostridium sp. TaxID=1506 RepID=UPI002850657A|nr:hypothetical protein [Clostridium sp.]MDR3597542.1 hypothetical protein [Clostridium sp.]
MVLFLLSLSGFCWTIVYIQLICLGFKEKTYGMPFVALALNFAWEAFYSYIGLKYYFTSIQTWITLIWLILDTLVVFTYLIYGKKYFPKHCSKEYFAPWTLIIFLMSFVLQYFFFIQFGDLGKVYSAFLQNLIMSILFINMLVHRSDFKGQDLTIAINKWIGTLAPTILFGAIYGNNLALVIGIFCSVFDLIYIYFIKNIKKLRLTLSKSSSTSKLNK